MAPLRIGIVGLDSSHCEQFTLRLHDPAHAGHVPGARVVAAWPGGSPDLPLSADRVAGFTAVLRDRHGVAILPSIGAVCAAVDAVMILSMDGRAHLSQVREVVAAGRPVFIDKPVAADLATAVAVLRLAAEAGVPAFSASATRFWSGVVSLAGHGAAPRVVLASGPAPTLACHAELFFYGIHTAETLFTVMGAGCRVVERVGTADASIVTGRWPDGRLGVLAALHGLPIDSREYAVTRVDPGRAASTSGVGDYQGLVAAIVTFFRTGRPPVSPRDTLEIYAFLEAAGASRRRGGAAIALRDVLAAAGCPEAWMETAP